MRELTSHKCSDLNEQIKIQVMDEPGYGGACHAYDIGPADSAWSECEIRFQKGAVKDAGLNGISDEALLAIVEDRLVSFQAGPFACGENKWALHHIQEALSHLKDRTRDRVKRGVEGRSVK